jgi:hypothetical protein
MTILSLCLSPYQLVNQLVDFYEIQYWGHAIEGNLEAIIFHDVAAIIPKWRTFRILSGFKTCISQQRTLTCILIDTQGIKKFNETNYVKNKKMETWRAVEN